MANSQPRSLISEYWNGAHSALSPMEESFADSIIVSLHGLTAISSFRYRDLYMVKVKRKRTFFVSGFCHLICYDPAMLF